MFNPQTGLAPTKFPILGGMHKFPLELCILDSNILESSNEDFWSRTFHDQVDQENKTHHTFQDAVRR